WRSVRACQMRLWRGEAKSSGWRRGAHSVSAVVECMHAPRTATSGSRSVTGEAPRWVVVGVVGVGLGEASQNDFQEPEFSICALPARGEDAVDRGAVVRVRRALYQVDAPPLRLAVGEDACRGPPCDVLSIGGVHPADLDLPDRNPLFVGLCRYCYSLILCDPGE